MSHFLGKHGIFVNACPFHSGIALGYWCCRASPILLMKTFSFLGIWFVTYLINYFIGMAKNFFCPLCWPRLEVSHIPLVYFAVKAQGFRQRWFVTLCMSVCLFHLGTAVCYVIWILWWNLLIFTLFSIFSYCEDGHDDFQAPCTPERQFIPFHW